MQRKACLGKVNPAFSCPTFNFELRRIDRKHEAEYIVGGGNAKCHTGKHSIGITRRKCARVRFNKRAAQHFFTDRATLNRAINDAVERVASANLIKAGRDFFGVANVEMILYVIVSKQDPERAVDLSARRGFG